MIMDPVPATTISVVFAVKEVIDITKFGLAENCPPEAAGSSTCWFCVVQASIARAVRLICEDAFPIPITL